MGSYHQCNEKGRSRFAPAHIHYNVGSVAHVRVISVLILLSDDIQIHAIHALLHSCAIVVSSSSAQNDLGCHGAQVGQRVGGHGEAVVTLDGLFNGLVLCGGLSGACLLGRSGLSGGSSLLSGLGFPGGQQNPFVLQILIGLQQLLMWYHQ